MTFTKDILKKAASAFDGDRFKSANWEGSFEDYLEICRNKPDVVRTAYQRVYDMVVSYGAGDYVDFRKQLKHYNFFDDPIGDGRDAIYGLDLSIDKFVELLAAAAAHLGIEKRIILLHGPVGSAKSTLARLLKKGLEEYSRTDGGALYSYSWMIEGKDGTLEETPCPMHEEPLHLLPDEARDAVLDELNARKAPEKPYKYRVEGGLCPLCRYYYRDLLKRYEGDVEAVIQKHVKVKRLILSEQDRTGIGTFQPKDEKNQDSTELTGDINYRKIAEYGSDSDPRAFNFDGEFNVANRGIIEFIEILKLDVAFLYDLLGASQEHKIKPKKFSQTDIDEVIIGHTNEPEFKRLQHNEFMEALRDRTVKIDVPYITKLSQEIKIYKRDFNEKKLGIHIAPHAVEVAAMWSILTRLEEMPGGTMTLVQKMKLYDGRNLQGFNEETVKELRKQAKREGMFGISPRYVQDKLSSALVRHAKEKYLSPFMVMTELESGLKNHSLITSDKERERYRELMAAVRQEYEEIVKNEVQRAISADEDAIKQLCSNYIENVKAYVLKEKVRNKYSGAQEEPDDRLMRSIEEKIDVNESKKDDFRREIMNYIAALALEGKHFDYHMNERLDRALELKLFEDRKDAIKLSSLVSNVVDREEQEKIEIIKNRLIKNYGYNDRSATDALSFVASIFARGDAK